MSYETTNVKEFIQNKRKEHIPNHHTKNINTGFFTGYYIVVRFSDLYLHITVFYNTSYNAFYVTEKSW